MRIGRHRDTEVGLLPLMQQAVLVEGGVAC
jgi:hypothetical protein